MEPRRRFKFLKELAQGGFGKVYLAEMVTGENFSTIVAIKLLHGRWLGNDEIVMRSRDEARLLGKLRHSNIVRVEDLTSINGQCAIVMEYLKGVDLKQVATWLKERNRVFPRKALFESIGAIATALEAAYSTTPVGAASPLSVIHRDIKPSNAMVTVEGDLKVLDFGTARATFEEREAKTQVLSFGSQAYMAPERMLGEPDTPAGDIFSLGITMYELLTLDSYGKIHLREERFTPSMEERVDAIDLSTLPTELHAEIRNALKLMLSYEPLVRPSSGEVIELMEALAERMPDAGIKRFARETVKDIIEVSRPEVDPNDPCVGQMLFEDTSSVQDPKATMTDILPPYDERRLDDSVDLPGGKPSIGVDAPAAFAAPPAPPNVQSFTPGLAGEGRADPSVSGAGPRVRGPSPAGDVTSGTLVLGQDGEPKPAGGGLVKVLAGLVVLGLGAVVIAAGLYFFVVLPKTNVTMPDIPTTTTEPGAALPPGSPQLDWTPNAAGKGGVILQAPNGATEVVVTQTGGFRAEWDGSFNLRLKDLNPGNYRAKVKAKGASGAALSDFSVDADKTCILKYDKGGTWEKGECR